MAHRLALQRDARRAVREKALVLLLANREAEVRAVAQAVDALAALRREERDDVVPDRERGDAVADLLDDARAFMAEHGRRVTGRIGARGGVEIGVTDAARNEAHEHLAGARLAQLDGADRERRAELLEDSCSDLHRVDPNRPGVRQDLVDGDRRDRNARRGRARGASASRGRSARRAVRARPTAAAAVSIGPRRRSVVHALARARGSVQRIDGRRGDSVRLPARGSGATRAGRATRTEPAVRPGDIRRCGPAAGRRRTDASGARSGCVRQLERRTRDTARGMGAVRDPRLHEGPPAATRRQARAPVGPLPGRRATRSDAARRRPGRDRQRGHATRRGLRHAGRTQSPAARAISTRCCRRRTRSSSRCR